MIKLTEVPNLEEYYKKLNVAVRISPIWNALQSKSEYGTRKSERGYQEIAKLMAAKIAIRLDKNVDLAEIMTMCKGAYFPACGEEGKKVVRQYLDEHGIDISDADLARNIIEYDLTRCNEIIAPEFDELLKELFDDSKPAKTPEIKIANLCNQTIKDIKIIAETSDIDSIELLYRIPKDVEECSINAGVPTQSRKLQELLKNAPPYERKKISEKDKSRIYDFINEFVAEELSKGRTVLDGVYRYIKVSQVHDLR